MRQKLVDLLRMGKIEPCNYPTYGSPAFMVPKNGNHWSFVVGLRRLNQSSLEVALMLFFLSRCKQANYHVESNSSPFSIALAVLIY